MYYNTILIVFIIKFYLASDYLFKSDSIIYCLTLIRSLHPLLNSDIVGQQLRDLERSLLRTLDAAADGNTFPPRKTLEAGIAKSRRWPFQVYRGGRPRRQELWNCLGPLRLHPQHVPVVPPPLLLSPSFSGPDQQLPLARSHRIARSHVSFGLQQRICLYS